jgi:hypothetical protein
MFVRLGVALVPEVHLGTHVLETLFRVMTLSRNTVSHPGVPKQEFAAVSQFMGIGARLACGWGHRRHYVADS